MIENYRNDFINVLTAVQNTIYLNNKAKGFWEEDPKQRNIGEIIALIHSELSEALEAHRHGNPPSEKIPGFSHFEEELADAVIRICDISGALNLQLGKAIIEKVKYNETRAHKHGKKF